MVTLQYSVCSSVVVVGVRDVLDLLVWAEEEEGAKAEKSKNLRVCKKLLLPLLQWNPAHFQDADPCLRGEKP